MKIIGLLSVVAFAVAFGFASCKTPNSQSGSILKDDETENPARKTADTLKFISDRVADGNWKWEVDKDKVNRDMWGEKVRTGAEYFSAPYKEVKVCPQELKVEVNGEEACLAYDNSMRYNYHTGQEGKLFNHLLAQKSGEAQPELDEFMQPGDIIVYFHPETRSGYLGEDGMQWRASHAATIVRKRGKLTTADTPAGYAQPFTGVDETPFHVFRFMPKDENGDDLPEEAAQRYRAMIAKWATLGFGQFDFNGDYDSAASTLSGPESVKTFGDEYLKAAITGRHNIPDMYCAWFVFTNLSLAWMHPMNERGFNGMSMASRVTPDGSFSNIQRGFAFNGNNAMSGYIDNDPSLVQHPDFVFPPFTGYELINGFMAKLIGPDSPELPPEVFVGIAKNKAGMLMAVSEDPGILRTFRSDPDHVPNYDRESADQFNQKIPMMMLEFAQLYNSLADAVAAGEKTVPAAVEELVARYQMRVTERDQVFRDVAKRWIPPYIYFYIADNYNALATNNKKPPLAYIGTVLHEKYLKPRGSQGGGDTITPALGISAQPEDKVMDKKMYELIGAQPRDDMKGYLHFFECLANADRSGCGDKIRRHMTKAESDALLSLANDWKVGAQLSEKDVLTRNKFGLDPVRFRRVLASYWNDPREAFRPNIFDDPSSQIIKVTVNFRILMNSPFAINDTQADPATYQTRERTETMVCIAATGEVIEGELPSCAHAVGEASERNYRIEGDPADSQSYAGFPATRVEPITGGNPGSGGGTVEEPKRCARLYTAANNRGRRKLIHSPYKTPRLYYFNDKFSSIIVDKGCELKVYNGYNYNVNQATGRRMNVGTETYRATNRSEKRVNLVGTRMNDKISSMKCECR